MVANLPYDLSEEKVCSSKFPCLSVANPFHSSRNSLPLMSLPLPRSPFALSPASW
jgi:hypothetical protein